MKKIVLTTTDANGVDQRLFEFKATEEQVRKFSEIMCERHDRGEGFSAGVLFAAQFLVITLDQPTMAKNMLKESGLIMCHLLEQQKNTGYHNDIMNRIIRDTFK